jgi:transcriptional regulator with XRE-family HTH domain
MATFGEKLRALRHKHNLTQDELAAQLGYSAHNIIGMIEAGKRQPTLDLIRKLVVLFNVSADVLIWDDRELEEPDAGSG